MSKLYIPYYFALMVCAGREQRRRKTTIVRNFLRMQDQCTSRCPRCEAITAVRPFGVADVEHFYRHAKNSTPDKLARVIEQRWNARNRIACRKGCTRWRVEPIMC